MSPPYFMLADTPEFDRDALLDRLQKRLATAEGLPAQLRLPMWNTGQQASVLYEKYAFPTSMRFESIPESYWYEARSGRVEVDFNQNVVFCGDQGYLHVRVLTQEDEGLTSTGLPGRPSKGKDLIHAEFQRRVSVNECEQTLEAQAQELHEWFSRMHPRLAKPTQKTIENNIRGAWRGRARQSTK